MCNVLEVASTSLSEQTNPSPSPVYEYSRVETNN